LAEIDAMSLQQNLDSYVKDQGLEDKLADALNTLLMEKPPNAAGRLAEILSKHSATQAKSQRSLSLPKQVAAKGGVAAWNEAFPELRQLNRMISMMCMATTVEKALEEVRSLMTLGHNLWSYAYMRMLYNKQPDIYYGALLASPSELLPVVYTPTVGEACQKFGKLPFFPRGCYVSIKNKGQIKKVLEEYAQAELTRGPDGKFLCDCIVFSDGGRILGLGDLAAWGMGIPIGKLDLYTVCAGVNPYRTVPVIIDAGCFDSSGNTDKLEIRDHHLYTGEKINRVTHTSPEGTVVNSAYYGAGNMIDEFMSAATDLFGRGCLLQFEDFNSNDAFPLLATYRNKFLSYNDDIQGTASVAVAALMGSIKLRNPNESALIPALRQERFLFHGAGSANIGGAMLLINEAGVPASQVFLTNSRGLIWKSSDGSKGSFRNDEQKGVAQVGEPTYDSKDLVSLIGNLKPTCLIGAVGRDPGCFDQKVIEKLVEVNPGRRPVVFALSNPKTQAEITAADAYKWSNGAVIYGSGTKMGASEVNGKTRDSGQVNNFYIFPGMSYGAQKCAAKSIPESLFMVAAQAVANSLSAEDMSKDRVVPHPDRIRDVSLDVATAVVVECQSKGLATKNLGSGAAQVKDALKAAMWVPGKGALDNL